MSVNSEIYSISSGPRQGNFELLRIAAMFMILIAHADFVSLGRPLPEEYFSDFGSSLCRAFFGLLTSMSVAIFVLISGWFRIRFSIKGLANYMFQCTFLILIIYVVARFSGWTGASIRTIVIDSLFYQSSNYWFLSAYLILYFLSPILNNFLDTASRRKLFIILAALSIFVVLSGFQKRFFCFNYFFGDSFSPLLFVYLYLLSAYIRKYGKSYSAFHAFILFSGCLLLNLICFVVCSAYKINIDFGFTNFSNPLLIGQAIGFLLLFNKWKVTAKGFITGVSSSVLAVYIIHWHPVLYGLYKTTCKEIYSHTSSVKCLLLMFTFLICVFCGCILIDKVRKFAWKITGKKIVAYLSHYINRLSEKIIINQ